MNQIPKPNLAADSMLSNDETSVTKSYRIISIKEIRSSIDRKMSYLRWKRFGAIEPFRSKDSTYMK